MKQIVYENMSFKWTNELKSEIVPKQWLVLFFWPSKILYIFCWRVVIEGTIKVDYVQLKGWLGKSKSPLRPIEMPYVYAQKLTLFKYRFILLLVEKALNFNESRKTHQKKINTVKSSVSYKAGQSCYRFMWVPALMAQSHSALNTR